MESFGKFRRAVFGPKNRAPQTEVVGHRAFDRVFVCFEGVCLHLVLRVVAFGRPIALCPWILDGL